MAALAVTTTMSRRAASMRARMGAASRSMPMIATGAPPDDMSGRNSRTVLVPPPSTSDAVGLPVRPVSATSRGAFASPRTPAAELKRIVPSRARTSSRSMSARLTRSARSASRTAARSSEMPGPKSAWRNRPSKKSSLMAPSRDTTAASMALETCIEATATRALAVIPTSTRKTP